jgi:hypothetical protein
MISSGAWTLFRANALCLVRRLLPLVRTNPVISGLAILGPVTILAGLAWAGARDVAALAATPGDDTSTAIVLTVGVLFALVGFSVRHVSSIDGSLDAQIRSAPLSRLGLTSRRSQRRSRTCPTNWTTGRRTSWSLFSR